MKYQEMIERGKRIFNFHPDEDFYSVGQVLQTARKNMGIHGSYECGAALYAETLAKYLDELKET